ncbi:TIGR01777 family oxidoreductase [Paenibacillus flagellatus]|uniref:TIGR01777 family protein n=1 Tax=Paenibacillus flagellatus TaxID=2211139 RepID=A0A2V5JU59_9BACL|nr:TIGR01777 family oxidoreductase [Paenibacillus flagellatus]PYI50079.1 TIGR01777 family protein [Paenibacillus flagellatus]
MKIAIGGGTGFIGRRLVRYLESCGDETILISRKTSGGIRGERRTIAWDELTANRDHLEGLDAIVNLSGESINQRWTDKAKRRVLQSRLETAAKLAELVGALENKPKVVVNGSGMSVYGTSETDVYDETSPPRVVDFLSGVVVEWERAADAIPAPRLVKLRVGLVLGDDGGALPLMALPYKLGVGGRVGTGRQWVSWIHIDDIVRLIRHCIERDDIAGPVNATAPNPVTNDAFGRALAAALHRPHWLPVPGFAFRLAFGEMADLLLTGQRVLPKAALEHGFRFRYETADEALKAIFRPGTA